MKREFGFTLAEILITLGIIGVVATMTIPMLKTKIQKKIYATKLIQTYAILNQGFKRYLSSNDVEVLSQTPAFESYKPQEFHLANHQIGTARIAKNL